MTKYFSAGALPAFTSCVQASTGTLVRVHAKRLHDGSGFAVTEARIETDGKRITDAELTFRIMDYPAPELADAMRGRGRELGLL